MKMRRSKRQRRRRRKIILFISILLLLGVGAFFLWKRWFPEKTPKVQRPKFDVALLTPNEYSRPGIVREKTNGIVVHYTANPGSTAMDNRNYFDGLKDSHATYASSHFVIGIDGEIVQCIPLEEMSYASNERNEDTIAIECCHPNKSGKFTEETYQSLVRLVAWLCGEYNLKAKQVIRHYDVTGKQCPLYFVRHEKAWKQFLVDVEDYIEKKGKKGV